MPGTGKTEVRLIGWREDGLGQQREGGGGCDNAQKIGRSRSPGAYVDD